MRVRKITKWVIFLHLCENCNITECWATKKEHANKLNVVKMRMLRWKCDKTRKNRIRNEQIREAVKVAPIV